MSWPPTFNQKWLATLLKSAVSVALLLFLLSRIKLEAVWRVLSEARMDYLAWALGAFLVIQVIGIYRWQVLASVLGFDRSFGQYASYYFAGLFFNLFLPTTVGGDLGRSYYLSGEKGSFMPAFITVLADRGCGMVALMGIATVAILIATEITIPAWITILTVGTTALLGLGLILPFVMPALFHRKGFPLEYWKRPGPLIQALLLSFGIQLAVVGINRLIGEALGLPIPSGFYFVFTPLVMAASMVPISLNGLGVREGAYVFFLLQASVEGAEALSFALLWLLLVILVGLLGGLAWILMPAPVIRSRKT